MKDQEFHNKIGELIEEIQELPQADRDRLKRIADEAKDRHAKMCDLLGGLQTSLDHLRLSVKYLVFDLEATRRENDYLRKLLEGPNQAEGN